MTDAAYSKHAEIGSADDAGWLRALRRFFVVSFPGHLLWEFAHMPLYTIWAEGSLGEILFAAVHCTGGDLLIATSALVLALVLFGSGWPASPHARFRVVAAALAIGLAYTVFSEWLNVVVRQAWAYSDLMPVIPWIGTGLSPIAQWLVVPLAGFWWALWPARKPDPSP